MSSKATFSRREVEAVLETALRSTSSLPDDDLTLDELAQVAEESGIDRRHLDSAVRGLAQRGPGRRRELIAVVLVMSGVVASLILFQPGANETHTLQMHNEHRWRPVSIELFVPRSTARDAALCTVAPSSRVLASDYCRLTRRWLAPGARMALVLPDAPRGCPQVWVRATTGRRSTSALFTLPASVEIERGGDLDQKGLGSPHMHAAPLPESTGPIPACAGHPAGGR